MFKRIIYIAVFLVFITFGMCNFIYAFNVDNFDTDGFVRDMIEKGIGSDIGNKLLESGVFGDEIKTHTFNKFEVLFKRSGKFDFTILPIYGKEKEYIFASSYNSADPYYKKIFDAYQELTYEVKESSLMDYYFREASKYSGIGDSAFARAVIETVVGELMSRRVLEVKKAYYIGCSGHYGSKGYKFDYNGKKHSCDEVYWDFTASGQEFGPQEFYYEYSQMIKVNARAMMDTYSTSLSDTVANHVKEDEHYLGSDANIERKKRLGIEVSSNKNRSLVFEEITYDTSYTPSLTNAVRFANQSTKVGNMDFVSNTSDKSGLLGVVVQITDDFAKVRCIYSLWNNIIFRRKNDMVWGKWKSTIC